MTYSPHQIGGPACFNAPGAITLCLDESGSMRKNSLYNLSPMETRMPKKKAKAKLKPTKKKAAKKSAALPVTTTGSSPAAVVMGYTIKTEPMGGC